ncbi:MAG TPA: nucleotidyltransferase domain-containing protein [Actinomycetota bacterium]|nr:nucleotidyltransferase domain-containing protein [Actinomycetota bacterium]
MTEIPPVPDTTILLVEVGSTAHGTGLPGGEDHDQMGIVVERPRDVLGLRDGGLPSVMQRTQLGGLQSGPGDTDRTLHSLRRFLRLAASGNPSILMACWAPVLQATAEGRELQAMGDRFIGRHLVARYRGYMQSQARELLAAPPLTRTFNTKRAMHACRLGYQGLELLTTRSLSLPMAGETAGWLRAVRKGEVPLGEWRREFERLDASLAAALTDGTIPEAPDRAAIEAWSIEVHLRLWGAA